MYFYFISTYAYRPCYRPCTCNRAFLEVWLWYFDSVNGLNIFFFSTVEAKFAKMSFIFCSQVLYHVLTSRWG